MTEDESEKIKVMKIFIIFYSERSSLKNHFKVKYFSNQELV